MYVKRPASYMLYITAATNIIDILASFWPDPVSMDYHGCLILFQLVVQTIFYHLEVIGVTLSVSLVQVIDRVKKYSRSPNHSRHTVGTMADVLPHWPSKAKHSQSIGLRYWRIFANTTLGSET